MRVLHVIGSLKLAGGIETALLRIFRTLDQSDLKMELCLTGFSAATLAPEFEKLGYGVWTCPQGRDFFSFMRKLRRGMSRRPAYDVVHAHVSHFSGPVLHVARKLGVPARIAQYHNLAVGHSNDWKRRLYERWMRRYVVRSATDIAALTVAGLRHWFPECWQSDPRMRVLRYGVSAAEFGGAGARVEVRREFSISPDAPLIGHVGRFVWQKNHERLVEAARLIVAQRPEARFLLVGEGDLRPKIAERVRRLGLEQHVIFAGLRGDVPRLLSAMDLLLFPSVVEGYGYCQLEAQMAGVPVVASRIPTAVEAVAPVFQEYLRDPQDAAGLAEATLHLLDRAKRDPKLAEQARAFAAQFTLERAAQAMLAAWRYPGAVAPPDPFGPLNDFAMAEA